jgi:glucose-6-phosphate-specific signal transduction histidine kinase
MFVVAFRKNWMGAAFSVAITGILFEAYLHLNKLPLELVIAQLAFGLFSAGSLLLGAAMSALRDSHFHLQSQHQEMALMNSELLKNSEELRHLSQRIIRVEEQGQRELASELDAELGQAMHRLGTNLNFAIRSVKEPETYRILSSVRDPIRDMEDSLRQVLQQLRPKILDEKGLYMAISVGPLINMLGDANISHSIKIEGPLDSLNEDQTTAIYRICQVAVRHACKLGTSKHVSIQLTVVSLIEHELDIEITITIDALEVMSHLLEKNPLVGIRDRVLALQGDYQVVLDPPQVSHRIHFRSTSGK